MMDDRDDDEVIVLPPGPQPRRHRFALGARVRWVLSERDGTVIAHTREPGGLPGYIVEMDKGPGFPFGQTVFLPEESMEEA